MVIGFFCTVVELKIMLFKDSLSLRHSYFSLNNIVNSINNVELKWIEDDEGDDLDGNLWIWKLANQLCIID